MTARARAAVPERVAEARLVLVIALSYSPYRVWIENPWDRKDALVSVDLSKNSQLRTGKKHQALVREGKRQMAADVDLLMLRASWPEMHLPLTLDAKITRRTKAHADDDGAWVGLYTARDAIAACLDINDADIVTGKITWATGEPEETLIEIRGQRHDELAAWAAEQEAQDAKPTR